LAAAHALSASRPLALLVQRLLQGAIRLYQLTLSPWLGRQCRYEPTCSVYAAEALERFGVRRGLWLAAKRLGRCHPWGGSGYDPVPSADRSA
jgi:putative membrane protein insertion efficiency factor